MKNNKKTEIDYPKKLNEEEKKWLRTKPFGNFNLVESEKTFRDFSTIIFLIRKHNPRAIKILDLGCGPGWLSNFLAKMEFNVSGYDISKDMISVAKEKIASDNLEVNYKVIDIEDDFDGLAKEKNDVVIFYDSLHHCQSDELSLKNAFSYLKEGGILILAEPNVVHAEDEDSKRAVERFKTTERGLDYRKLIKKCKQVGFKKVLRYHASGQSYSPRNEEFIETVKMLVYPFLARFYFGKKRTRIWIVAEK